MTTADAPNIISEFETWLMPNYGPPSIMFVRGQGTELWDRDGKRYLDFVGGLAVQALGHAHPEVAEAIAEQAAKLVQVSNLWATEHAHEVAQTLDRLLGGGGQVFFCNSGAEANEFAFKLARKWAGHGRHGVVTTFGSFHGRTLAALAACGQPNKHEPFAPMPEGFKHVARDDVAALENALDPSTAAIHLEPVQGEGGVWPNSQEFMDAARRLADERNLLFSLDEVQSGLCRTGKWFAVEHYRIQPDVVCMAKALGNGFPIAAVWAKREIAAVLQPGDHGSTYGGNALATAAARKVLEVMEREDLPAKAAALGDRLSAALAELPRVVDVRGMGGMLAAELDGEISKDVAAKASDAGLLVNPITPTALRLTPPLTTSADQVDEAMGILGAALA
ncbi:MAG: acetylornithine/succinylornithine family transaminase [Actinomycetota bacterium]